MGGMLTAAHGPRLWLTIPSFVTRPQLREILFCVYRHMLLFACCCWFASLGVLRHMFGAVLLLLLHNPCSSSSVFFFSSIVVVVLFLLLLLLLMLLFNSLCSFCWWLSCHLAVSVLSSGGCHVS